MIDSLNALVGDYQVLYQKLRGYHWNVTGRMFFELHKLFEELYDEAAEIVDELAERIRALGGRPASTLKEQLSVARLKEDDGAPDGVTMVRNVAGDLGTLKGLLRETSGKASSGGDTASANLLDGIADKHEKNLWMLGAWLEG